MIIAMLASSFCGGCLGASVFVFLTIKRMLMRERARTNAILRAMDKGHLLRVIDNHEKEAG